MWADDGNNFIVALLLFFIPGAKVTCCDFFDLGKSMESVSPNGYRIYKSLYKLATEVKEQQRTQRILCSPPSSAALCGLYLKPHITGVLNKRTIQARTVTEQESPMKRQLSYFIFLSLNKPGH